MALPLRHQGTLLTGVRGCDLAPKPQDHSTQSVERHLVAFLRTCCLRPADSREVDVPGAWFQSRPPSTWKASQITHYPVHWYAHLMHCFEVVAYKSPVVLQATMAWQIYKTLAEHLHLNVESQEALDRRLTEDRIVAGTIVS